MERIAGFSGHDLLILLEDFNINLRKRFHSDPDLEDFYIFGKVSAQPDVSSNRNLLFEMRQSHQLAIANTFSAS